MRKKFSVVRRVPGSGPTDDAARLAELERTVLELRRFQELATDAEDRLRRELADVLHNRVQSRLLAATLRLRRVEHLLSEDPAAAARFLEEVRRELDDIREDDVREISHLLHPAVVAVGLVPALRRLAKDLRGAAEVTVSVSPEQVAADDLGDPRVPEEVRLALYRLVEEATTNALKHGDATEIQVRAETTAQHEVRVTVSDNGCGFDPADAPRGLGLLGVEGRLAQHGGRVEVRSAPGSGTAVVGIVPVVGLPDAAPAQGQVLGGDLHLSAGS